MDFYYEVLRAHITPEVLGQLNERKIILESTSQQQLKGRYSIVAFEPYGTVKLNDNSLMIETLKGTQTITSEPYNYLKSYINQFDCDIDDETLKQLPFIAGFIGTCSFDLVRHEFPILQRIAIESKKTTHDATLYMIEDVYVFDHYKDELYVIASNQFSKVSKTELKTRVARNVQSLSHIQVYQEDIKKRPKRSHIKANISDEQFIHIIQEMKRRITEGDMFQVVPSRIYSYEHHFKADKNQLSYQLYQNLKRKNPSPYMYYINMDREIIVGSSPESFVAVHYGEVTTNPIAGTIQRGTTPEKDERNANQLITDEKERSEHSMLVDLGRNDIHRVSITGSSEISKLMVIEKYEHVMHIVSEVKGKIKKGLSPMTIIASLLPTGTVSGAPKLRAIQRIYEAYPYKRGVYSGGVGYINCNQNLDFALAIRTMLIDDNTVNVEAGCGVVYDSVPEKELEETRLKAKSLLEVTP
ncbi:anthranilate synthase component I [Staphylococcus borealis]|uniref:anthranilate synthase component I n=1 Tax=Staphylococcus borealis TaxID=2742203 RepID=UPI002DBF428A|nr:anthranilate synthase component I [Staphylococcus borealis]MEB6610110.1 anthranilate synthase component I [Staphylococcus borealis]